MLLAAFRLAFYFRRPVSELNISVREFYWWLAYLQIEPPEEAANYRNAALMAKLTNVAGRALPDRKMVKPSDFLGSEKKQPAQTADEQKAFMRSL